MKLQYIFWYDEDLDYYTINIYHDGELIKHHEYLDTNDGHNLINRLKKQGYTPAFLDENIETARMEYEYMLEHRLAKRGE